MLRLRSCILARLHSSPYAVLLSPLHRLLSAAAPAVSPNPSFAVDEYLVATCGLTRAQALKASAKLSHLKSATNPDAVLAFLAGLGLSSAHVAAAVAKDPLLLCASVERTLTPTFVGLTRLGLSHSEIACLVSLRPASIRQRSTVSNLQYYLSLFGSYDRDYYSAVMVTEKVFMEKFVCPHKEVAPHLAEDYAAACRGKMPTRFRFT